MDDNCNSYMVNQFSELLLEYLSHGDCQQVELNSLIAFSDEIIEGASRTGQNSITRLVTDVRSLLERHQVRGSNIKESESDLLKLAGDWLIQLTSLRNEGLAEPATLVGEVHHLFDLARADFDMNCKNVNENIVDPFAEDEMLNDSSLDVTEQVPFQSDPFEDDPGLSSGLERLQRTITHVKSSISSRRQVEDPFAVDPSVVATGSNDDLVLKTVDDGDVGVDIFSDDPDLGLD